MTSQTPDIRPKACETCPIRERAVCSHCSGSELEELDQFKYYRTYEAGQPIIFAGDKLEFVGSIVKGVATLTQTMEDGRRQMTGLLLPSDFVGRPGREIALYDVTATTEVVMCCFRIKPFEALLAKTPHLSQRLLEMTLDELDAAREWLLLLGRKTAREKIASLLKFIAKREFGQTVNVLELDICFDLPLTREAMADYLGLTLETVSRQISALKREGIITLKKNRSVTVPDVEKLFRETGDDHAA
ncbi:transcriptional regulator FnrL [Halocynthiibacter namhaensis]|uniref:transcriptional regulator FnrL n=1 Tax=Halocynthiibacter namhaensis TaxID=1290553 RepID=UPI0005798BAE|nr:Crp/Fnr family transcriptional regulator [Halocynthiibacter namhaensis]